MTENWQPIDTAPKDGWIIACGGNSGDPALWKWNTHWLAKKPKPYWECCFIFMGVQWMRAHQPTHWMPLPAPPKQEASE
jgi:hypothetical protein